MSENNNMTAVSSIETCMKALKEFSHAISDERKTLEEAAAQMRIAMKNDSAATETIDNVHEVLLPALNGAVATAGTLVESLANYRAFIIRVYENYRRDS